MGTNVQSQPQPERRQRRERRFGVPEQGTAEQTQTAEAPAAATTEATAQQEATQTEAPSRRGPRGDATVGDAAKADGATVLKELLNSLATAGKAIVIKATGKDTFTVTTVEAVAAQVASPKRGAGYKEADFWSDEYKAWQEEWSKLSPDEKVAYGHSNKIVWEEHTNALLNIMRLGQAVCAAKNIQKYKPGFESRKSRLTGIANA